MLDDKKRVWILDRLWHDHLIDDQRMPKFKVHGMGVTTFSLMRRYPWFSVDSTSWVRQGAFGNVYFPKAKPGGWDFEKMPMAIGVSNKSPKTGTKDIHVHTLRPEARKIFDRYIVEMGFVMGKSKFVDGDEVVLEPGLSNTRIQRLCINAMLFANFINAVPWPRPFLNKRVSGLGLMTGGVG